MTTLLQPVSLTLDCSRQLYPASFFGTDWSIWRGPIDGDGLYGKPDIDPRADSLGLIDFSQVLFQNCLKKGESSIKGEKKIRRLKKRKAKIIRYGGSQFLALRNDWQKRREQSVLEYLRKMRGITYTDFTGLILRDPNGRRCVPCLIWNGDKWDGSHICLSYDWINQSLSMCSLVN